MDTALSSFLSTFNNFVKKPQEFLSVQEEIAGQVKDLIKQVYDHSKETEGYNDKKTLPKLIVNAFDEEQIWQQLELQNGSFTDETVQIVSHLSAKKDKLKFPLKLKCNPTKEEEIVSEIKETEKDSLADAVTGKDKQELIDDEDTMEDEEDTLEDEENILEDEGDITEDEDMSENEKVISQKRRLKPSIVDDKFFKLSELEVFLQREDKKEDKPDEGRSNFDLFENIDDREGADYKYSDFFAKPDDEPDDDSVKKDDNAEDLGESDESDFEEDMNTGVDLKRNERTVSAANGADDVPEDENPNKDTSKKKVKFALLDSDDDDDDIKSKDKNDNESTDPFLNSRKTKKNSTERKSSFEERQERLGRVIGRLEEDALSEKPWQLKGEITANLRPQNSLLEEAVDFDLSMRPAPVISEEVTLRLEDIIMQRIKDKAWDDVERKVKPVDTPLEFKKKLTLDQEKSKLSLAEVYEQEFIKQREAATADSTERQEVEPALHVETRSMLHALFNKLDALSNYHFTPRPVAPELKVVSNVSAVVMEEVAPVTVADSALLAPQEIRGKKQRVVLLSKEERTETDKKRARRLKKTRQRQRQREKERMAKQISKMNPGLGNKYSKMNVQTDILKASSNISKMEEHKDKVIKSSTAFFNKLQDEVKTQIKTKTSFTKKRDKRNITAKRLKL